VLLQLRSKQASKTCCQAVATSCALHLRDAGDLKALLDSLFADRLQASVKSPTELAAELAQPDLAYIQSILVSAGWNLNDDVFLPDEMWAARATPVHKPINVEHNETKIIGHMIQSQAVDKQGNVIEVAEGEQPPAEIDSRSLAFVPLASRTGRASRGPGGSGTERQPLRVDGGLV